MNSNLCVWMNTAKIVLVRQWQHHTHKCFVRLSSNYRLPLVTCVRNDKQNELQKNERLIDTVTQTTN